GLLNLLPYYLFPNESLGEAFGSFGSWLVGEIRGGIPGLKLGFVLFEFFFLVLVNSLNFRATSSKSTFTSGDSTLIAGAPFEPSTDFVILIALSLSTATCFKELSLL